MRNTIFILATALTLIACSAKPVVKMVDPDREISGVPMRIKTDQIVHIFRLNLENDQYAEVSSIHQVLADQTRLFAVDVESWPFASPGLRITENPDNTLRQIQISSTQNQSGAIDAATQGLTGVTAARNARTTACQTSNSAALTASQAVATAQGQYDQLPATATPQQRAALKQVIANAQQALDYANAAPPCH